MKKSNGPKSGHARLDLLQKLYSSPADFTAQERPEAVRTIRIL